MTVKSQTGLYNLNVKYSSIGSKAWEARLADRAKKLAEREALWEKSLWDFPKTDSVVSSAFRRQGELKNRLVVVDVTGSMNPYLDQVIYWYKLNFSQNGANHFVLFNDGDATPDHKKIIGKTGGIYICKSCDMQNLGITARKARAGGNGGDGPENNIEALLKGIEGISGFEEIIMIADNFADVKDISLLPALVAKKKPIKIILCGVQNEINEDYLNIAYHTKGSLHLIQQDLFDLSKTTEGNRVKIGDDHYLLHNGKFFLDNKK